MMHRWRAGNSDLMTDWGWTDAYWTVMDEDNDACKCARLYALSRKSEQLYFLTYLLARNQMNSER